MFSIVVAQKTTTAQKTSPSVNGVHFLMAPVALKSDWTVKLSGQRSSIGS
ncbi:hypothetical protein T4E_4238 [Trichinella pseudospiralis]|uniref:Uncharacterized protein n=1 Tax=Trichinella pseudospiralis TaxID=6337 RepID=A0A0V0Y1T0_TRIPS|nr:hypothetical protein T4E_4238 [Trichinella pseudospiralis]